MLRELTNGSDTSARFCLVMMGILLCLFLLQCADDRLSPVGATAQLDTLPADTCTIPVCYPDPGKPPMGFP